MLADKEWPVANPDLARDDEIEIGIQVNGKLRDTITLPLDCAEEDAQQGAGITSVGCYLDGNAPKVIVVKNRIINVVIYIPDIIGCMFSHDPNHWAGISASGLGWCYRVRRYQNAAS